MCAVSQEINGWEVISKEVPQSSFWEALLHLLDVAFFLGLRSERSVKFTLRQKSTGYIRTIMAYDETELPERISKGLFHVDNVISEDAGEIILTGIRSGGEARACLLQD